MLAAHQVTFFRRERRILGEVSAELAPGKVTALLGPNGAGKSTLLKLLSGELQPQIGEVQLGGRALKTWPPGELARRRAVLPQESHLAFAFSAREVVMMGRLPHLRRAETPRDWEICDEALNRVDAAHLAHRIYPTLSGGEKQRVQLARVFAQLWEPAADGETCLLLDEPTSNLDLAHLHAILQLAADWARQGAAVLAVLHDLNLALAYADNAWVLKRSKLVAAGAIEDVLRASFIEEVFDVQAEFVSRPGQGRPFLITRPKNAGGARTPRPIPPHP